MIKYNRIYRTLAVAVVFSLLVIIIPAAPALAAEEIELSPTTAKIGDEIKVRGDGFKTDKTKVYLYFSSQEGAVYDRIDNDITVYKLAKKTTPDVNGKVKASFNVPEILDQGIDGGYGGFEEVVGGSYYLYVTYGDDDKIEAVAGFTVRGIALNPTSGVVSDAVAVSGVGFGEELSVSITFAGDDVSTGPASVKTDEDGNFAASFRVPDVVAATYAVKVEDKDGNNAEAEFTVAVAPDVSISPVTTEAAPAYVGMNIAISGIGFQANVSITITDTTSGLLLAVTSSSINGNFQSIFAAEGRAGEHIITASDDTTTRQGSFIMESQAPQNPALLLPQDDTEAGAVAYFAWRDVADDSLPLTYALQVASSENFTPSSIVLEKTGLASSDYTVVQKGKLKPSEAPYYWRVKAIDGAANEGEWSTARSFYIVKPAQPSLPVQPERSGWLIYLWIGLGIVGAGFLGYWLRKRIVRSRQV